MSPNFEMIVKVLAAAAAGVIIGLDRERSGKPAGIRTQMLVCVGSALLAGISVHLKDLYPWPADIVRLDPARLMAQIVSGIGFLGVGVILKNGNKIMGLTTAATIWTTSAIGIAIGAGFYWPAVITTGLVLLLNPLAHFQYVYGLKNDCYLLRVKRRHELTVDQILRELKIGERQKELRHTQAIFTILSANQRNRELEKRLEQQRISFIIEKVDHI